MTLRRSLVRVFLITGGLLLSGFRACSPDLPVGDDSEPALGDRCLPSHTPWFHANEVYAETSHATCQDACVVFGLEGDLDNLRSDGCPAGEEGCVDDVSPARTPLATDHAARAFCSCRCAADPLDPGAPLCDCPSGMACSDEGWCASPAALERDLASGTTCMPEHVPPSGFVADETYVETDHPDCGMGLACVVSHLDGDPRNLASEGCPSGDETCVNDAEPLGSEAPLTADDLRRVTCGCRCAPDPLAPDAPLCPCTNGLICSSEGFCAVPGA
jgi:hypothetical protein